MTTREILNKIAESDQRDTDSKLVTGYVTVAVDGQKFDYSYSARVTFTTDSWEEPRPYGMGTVNEPVSSTKIDDVDVIDVVPDNGGPPDHPTVIKTVIAAARRAVLGNE